MYPFPIWNQSVVPWPVLTVASWPAHRFLSRHVRWSGIAISWRIFQFVVIPTLKGFSIVNEAEVKFAQSCPTLCVPMDYTIHGILQARILEWVAFLFSRGSSQPRDQTKVSLIAGGFFTSWATRKAQEYCSGLPIPSPVDLPDPGIQLGSPALQTDSLPTELSGKPLEVKDYPELPAGPKMQSKDLKEEDKKG